MDTLAKADIFFFITSIAVVVISILLAIGLVYVIIILKSTKKFIEQVKEEGTEVIEDIKELRVKLKAQEGALRKLPALFTFFKKVSGIASGRGKK